MKHLRIILWALAGTAFLVFIALALPRDNQNTMSETMSFQPVAGFNQGSDFQLTSHTGKVFDSRNDIHDDEYALIFFGFTHCPVICPTELQKFSETMDMLSDEAALKIKPLFITIDPERDTVDVMREYVPLFHPAIIGLTGDVATVHGILDEWKVFYSKVNDPQMNDYTMDHSTYSYLVDSDMKILSVFRMQATAEEIAARINDLVAVNK